MVKIGFWDTEWSPAVSYTWTGFPKHLPNDFLIEDPRLLCWGFRFLHEKKTTVVDERVGREEMLQQLWEKLDDTDILVSYNGISFDTPKINSEFMKYGMKPPSPFKQIDLYRQIRKNAKFYSGKLDFVAERIIGQKKVDTGGFQLWVDVMNGDEKAWNKFRRYQKQDVDLLIDLYKQVLPWLKIPHPVTSNPDACRACGSTNIHKRGFVKTLNSEYQQLRCMDCGKWMRGLTRYPSTNLREA